MGTMKLIATKYDGSQQRSPGRPHVAETIRELVVRMATENVSWGYTRIQGALLYLGHEVGRNTVKRILAERGIERAGRCRRTSWSTFLKAHWGAIAATDFFTVEVLTTGGLIRYFVLFVIDLKTRQVNIAGISHQPENDWMKQMARNLTDVFDGFLRDARYLIHDREPLFSEAFHTILAAAGVQAVKLPAKSPNLNAYAERFVRSIKEECLDRMVLLGEHHLAWLFGSTSRIRTTFHTASSCHVVVSKRVSCFDGCNAGLRRRRIRSMTLRTLGWSSRSRLKIHGPSGSGCSASISPRSTPCRRALAEANMGCCLS